jgi:crossover junction endodeoxyribonuclease RuvC
LILGIDPGLTGGLVWLDRETLAADVLTVIPTIGKQLNLVALSSWLEANTLQTEHAYLEQVHAMPKQGVSSSFKFGRVYGACEALLVAHRIPYELVSPAKWQRQMHAGIERSLEPKQRSLMAVQRLLPGLNLLASERCRKPHAGLVDAALIALYGLRQHATNPPGRGLGKREETKP